LHSGISPHKASHGLNPIALTGISPLSISDITPLMKITEVIPKIVDDYGRVTSGNKKKKNFMSKWRQSLGT